MCGRKGKANVHKRRRKLTLFERRLGFVRTERHPRIRSVCLWGKVPRQSGPGLVGGILPTFLRAPPFIFFWRATAKGSRDYVVGNAGGEDEACCACLSINRTGDFYIFFFSLLLGRTAAPGCCQHPNHHGSKELPATTGKNPVKVPSRCFVKCTFTNQDLFCARVWAPFQSLNRSK